MAEDRFGIVGKVIARTYKVREVVAEGGFGVVYRAYHQGFRAEVALKCLKIPNELTDDQRKYFLEQFRSEAELLFRLSARNSHIVRPLHVDAFHTSSQKLVPFMALEWLEGRTLDGLMVQRAEKGRAPIRLSKLVRLLTPVAEALEQAHNLPGENGPQIVIHRDMKPENLFLARVGNEDVAKILDFGISKVKSTAGELVGRASINADALVAFSPAYGAPEQWAPRRYGQTGRWTDVWGLALTVVEVAKGSEVIMGDQAAMMGTILDPERRPTPRNEQIEVSDVVENVFARALAVDPRQRYQSVGAFWDDLTQALGLRSALGRISIEQTSAKDGRSTTDMDSVHPAEKLGPGLSLVPPAGVLAAEKLGSLSAGAAQGLGQSNQSALGEGIGLNDAGSEPRLPAELGAARPGPGGASRPGAPLAGVGIGAPNPGQPRPAMGSSWGDGYGGHGSGGASRPSGSYDGAGYGGVGGVSARPSRYVARRSSYAPLSRPSMWKALSPAVALMALSLAFTLLDRAFAHSRGQPLSFGPLPVSWISGALMVLALVTGIVALKKNLED